MTSPTPRPSLNTLSNIWGEVNFSSMWSKLLSRKDTDIPTISTINIVFYNLIWEFTKVKKEIFFSYFHQDDFSHYINTDSHKIGTYLYKKYFNTPQKIIKYYEQGKILIRKTEKQTNYWKSKLKNNKSQKTLLSAFKQLQKDFIVVNYNYSVGPWYMINAWQKDFEKIINKIISRNNLFNIEKQILSYIDRKSVV